MNKIDKIIQGMQTADLPSNYWTTSNIKFPELEASKQIIQRNDQSIWDHTMSVIDLLAVKNPITLLSGLLHDLGKCYTQNTNNPSLPRFSGHAINSASIAKARLIEWGATTYIIDRVIRIIITHMYDISNVTQEKTIRKFVAYVGRDNIENWFVVRRADSASYSKYGQYQRHIIDSFYKRVKEYLEELFSEYHPLLEYEIIHVPTSVIIMEGKECKDNDIFLLTEGE